MPKENKKYQLDLEGNKIEAAFGLDPILTYSFLTNLLGPYNDYASAAVYNDGEGTKKATAHILIGRDDELTERIIVFGVTKSGRAAMTNLFVEKRDQEPPKYYSGKILDADDRQKFLEDPDDVIFDYEDLVSGDTGSLDFGEFKQQPLGFRKRIELLSRLGIEPGIKLN